jgi:molybdate transport system ATP-binding protein
LVVIGPSGSGKTALLSMLLGALPVTRGRIEVAGTVLLDTASGINVPLQRRGVAYVPQDYALFPHLTVRENVDFALRCAARELRRSARSAKVDATLREIGLAGYGDRRTQNLSGGERQRVALARALSVSPRALLMDEPLAALDVLSRREVRRFLVDHLQRLRLPTVIVTHDAEDAVTLGDRVAVLENGAIVQTGRWSELEQRPISRFVEEMVAARRRLGEREL